MKPKILVLGGSGFVGKEVVRTLCKGGHAVRATYENSQREEVIGLLDAEWVEVDLGNSESIRSALQGCVAVIHAAGYEPESAAVSVSDARRRGVGELRRVLDECLAQKVVRIVYVSSISTMNNGEPDRVYDEADFYTPGQFSGAYYEAKYSMEAELYRYFDKGLEIVVALPSLVLGPGCIDSPASEILREILHEPAVTGTAKDDGATQQRLNVVDVRDVAGALVAAMERGRAGRRYALGGINTDVQRVRELIVQALEDDDRSVDEFLTDTHPTHLITELAEKLAGSRARQIVGKLAKYAPESLTDSLGDLQGLRRGRDLQSGEVQWYGVHVNSQRARGELGHRPRLLAQIVASSVDVRGVEKSRE